MSHLTRGAWIEILAKGDLLFLSKASHLTRGAWIEIFSLPKDHELSNVAPHTRCVD